MQCECGHQKEFHDPKLYPLNGSKCIGGRCGCSGFKAKITVLPPMLPSRYPGFSDWPDA